VNFVSPERFAWLLIALPIILFYVLRTRLRRQPVATLLFWDQLFDEKRQRSLWQRLRHWLSLLLQLAFLGLLVAAIVDPLWTGQTEEPHEVVIVLDNSASMQAISADGSSRFAQAIQKAIGVVASLRDGDHLALVTAGSTVRVVVGMTDFKPAVRDAINEIELTDGPTRVSLAIDAARRLTRSKTDRDIVLITDRCYEAIDTDADDLSVHSVGDPVDNVAITSLSLRRSLVDPIGYAALIKVDNFSQQTTDCRLTIELADELVDVIPLSIAAGESWKKTFVGASASGGVLTVSIDVDDGLQIDDSAIAILPVRPKIPVILVSEESSLYLESVLEAIPLIELTTVTTPPPQAPAGGFVVLHRVTPERLPKGAVFAIDPRSDCDLWKLGPPIEQAIVATQNTTSPLMPHLRLMNVLLPGARELQLADTATPLLVDANGMTLMASMIRDQHRVIVLSTDLTTSDLPLRIAFPVMMTNAVNWFLGRTGELEPALVTGELSEVVCGPSSDQRWSWQDSAGHTAIATIDDNIATVGPIDRVGIALLGPSRLMRSGGAAQGDDLKSIRSLAVNLCDARESNLRPDADWTEDDSSIASTGHRPPWFYLALVALGLIVGEWFLYQRRIVG